MAKPEQRSPLSYSVEHHAAGITRREADSRRRDVAQRLVVVSDTHVASWGPDGKPLPVGDLWAFWCDLGGFLAGELAPGFRRAVLLGALAQVRAATEREAAGASGEQPPTVDQVLAVVGEVLGPDARTKVVRQLAAMVQRGGLVG